MQNHRYKPICHTLCVLKIILNQTKKAYGWGIMSKSQEVMKQLYKILVWLHLKYCVQFYLPHCRKDLEALQRMQEVHQRLPGLEGINCKESLKTFVLFFSGMLGVQWRPDRIERHTRQSFSQGVYKKTRDTSFKIRGAKFNDVQGHSFS